MVQCVAATVCTDHEGYGSPLCRLGMLGDAMSGWLYPMEWEGRQLRPLFIA